jgi:hypothetical protein
MNDVTDAADLALADLRRAATTVIVSWNLYFEEPSINAHRQLRDAISALGKAVT